MKVYTKLFFIFSLLITPSIIFSMEQESDEHQTQEERIVFEDLGLPNEMWADILVNPDIYYNPIIIDNAKDIFEALDIIDKYLDNMHKNISLVCKTFKAFNIGKESWLAFKQQIREFYILQLNKKFLETREGKEGLYPKTGKWHSDSSLNQQIAQFIMDRVQSNLLHNLIKNTDAQNLKLIKVLLFYGDNPNDSDILGYNTLMLAVINHGVQGKNNIDIIKLLLLSHANPNHINTLGYNILMLAVINHGVQGKNNIDIIKLLLLSHANPNIKAKTGETAFDLAKKFKFHQFPQLVEKYTSKDTLKKICILHIAKNWNLYKNRLHTLPLELQEMINDYLCEETEPAETPIEEVKDEEIGTQEKEREDEPSKTSQNSWCLIF